MGNTSWPTWISLVNSSVLNYPYSTERAVRGVDSSTNMSEGDIGNLTTAVPIENEPQGLLSDSTAHIIQTAVEVGILPVLVTCGVTMNVINMVVFLRQGLSDRINLCLFSLAISDTGYIVTLLTTRLHSTMSLIDPSTGRFWKLWSLHLVGVYCGFLSTSNCLTLLISLERCLLVISPLKAKTLLSVSHMAGVIFVAFLACLSCLSIFGTKFDVITVVDPETNVTSYQPAFSQFYLDNKDPVEFLFQTFNAILPTLTFIGVIIATSVIAVRMRAVTAWRQKSANLQTTAVDRQETSVTRMLFVVCIMYTVCSIPSVVRPLVTLGVYEFQPGMRYANTMFTSVSLMHLMSAINCSLNFIIYYVMSTRFRETLKEVFSCRQSRKHDSNSDDVSTKTSNVSLKTE